MKLIQLFILNFLLITSLAYAQNQETEVIVPAASEWTDHGVVLTPSTAGWDRYFGGMAPATVIKKGDTYFMYYVGTVGPRSTDGGPKDRAIGVATSNNGIDFTKHSGNPVLRYQPHGNQEEGIFSAAAALDDSGNIVLYYGAIWAANSTTEDVDVFVNVARSSNGLNFSDLGTVQSVGENLGENWPFSVVHNTGGSWYVWYGRNNPTSLLVGSSVTNMQRVGSFVPSIGTIWYGMQTTYLGNNKIAHFVDNPIKVWVTTLSPLASSFTQVATYSMPSNRTIYGIAVYLDRSVNKWFMYYRTGTIDPDKEDRPASGHVIRARSAPVKYVDSFPVDPTPPAPPINVCHLLDSSQAVPAGFAASFNVHSPQRELIMGATCNVSSVNYPVGSGQETQYIYNKGYYWTGSNWQEYPYSCSNLVANSWCVGNANFTRELSATQQANTNYYLTFICDWNGSQWKCGCRDQSCTQSFWNLQAFRK